jgi:hypothetical protein
MVYSALTGFIGTNLNSTLEDSAKQMAHLWSNLSYEQLLADLIPRFERLAIEEAKHKASQEAIGNALTVLEASGLMDGPNALHQAVAAAMDFLRGVK